MQRPHRPPLGAFTLSLLVLLVLPLSAQDQSPPSPSTVLARLRAPDLKLADAGPLVQQLRTAPVAIRLQAIDTLVATYRERTKLHGKTCETLQKQLTDTMTRVQKQVLGKQGAAKADELRARALAISRREGLTKEIIHSDIDPLVDELQSLLWPTLDQLKAADDTLGAAIDKLREERGAVAQWYGLYVEAAAGLEMHPAAQKHFEKLTVTPPLPADTIDDEIVVRRLLAMPLAARDRRPLEDNETLRAQAEPQEFAGTTELNRIRYLLGLPLLRIDERLTKAARDHSTDMHTLGFFAHESPVEGKRTPSDRASRFGTSAGAENIAQGHDTGIGAIRGWWYSPGHHRNMLGGHARTGLGRCQQIWTQMFGS